MPLPGRLSVGAPYRAERAVFWTAAHRLHRRPHVAIGRQQVPSGGHEIVAADTAAVVVRLRRILLAVAKHIRPDEIAVAGDDGVRCAVLAHFVREECGVNSPEDDKRTALPGGTS